MELLPQPARSTMMSPMFALLAIAPFLGVGAQELYECLDGGVGRKFSNDKVQLLRL